MDTKTIAFGIAVIAASVGGSAVVGGKTTTTIVAASEKPVDVAVAQVASIGATAEKSCELVRVGTQDGVVLQWACGGAVMPQATQDELNKMAGDKATSIKFVPREVDGKTVLDATVTEGEKPNTLPVPEATEEVKPAEAPEGLGAQTTPVGK